MADTHKLTSQKHAAMLWLWRIVSMVVIVLAAGILLLVLGAFRDPTRSMHGMVGSAIWTTFGPHLIALGLVCTALGGLGYKGGGGASPPLPWHFPPELPRVRFSLRPALFPPSIPPADPYMRFPAYG